MKKLLCVVVLLSGFLSADALCPIDANSESVCSLTNFQSQNTSIFQNTNSETNLQNREINLESMHQVNPIQNREPNNMNLKYDSGCQFGNCVQDLNNTNNKNQ